jgi:hypothetical protein
MFVMLMNETNISRHKIMHHSSIKLLNSSLYKFQTTQCYKWPELSLVKQTKSIKGEIECLTY